LEFLDEELIRITRDDDDHGAAGGLQDRSERLQLVDGVLDNQVVDVAVIKQATLSMNLPLKPSRWLMAPSIP
jgi:hypothetical protein